MEKKLSGTEKSGKLNNHPVPSKKEKERIENMFRSGDDSLVRLAQTICHDLRLNYYILVVDDVVNTGILAQLNRSIRVKVIKSKVFSISKKWLEENYNARKIYEIKLTWSN